MTERFTDEEKVSIERFANCDDSFRQQAIAAFRRVCNPRDYAANHDSLHFKFMSEVTSPCPDYLYRSQLRAKLMALSKGQQSDPLSYPFFVNGWSS